MKRFWGILLAILFPVFAFSNNEKAEIKPLLKSEWGGGNPYNATVKELIGWDSPGCVPIAISQILYFYKYPEIALHNGQYKTAGGVIKEYPMSEIPFQWNLMKDSYSDSDNPDSSSSRAVADLMFATTLTLLMNHAILPFPPGPLYNSEAASLEYYFGYNNSVIHLSHDYFDAETWSNIIYYELSQGRPVLFSGSHPLSSHAFICDGYKDGYFHFNWGWGYDDGKYYDLETFRNPDNPNIDGFYKYNTQITILIQPGNIKTKPSNPYLKYNSVLKITSDFGQTFAYEKESIYDFLGEIGLKIISKDGNASYVKIENISITDNYPRNCDIKTNLLGNLKDGDYSAYPVYRRHGENSWSDMMVPLKKIKFISFNVKNGKITFLESAKPEYYCDVNISEFRPLSTAFENSRIQFEVKGENLGNIPYFEWSNLRIYKADSDEYVKTIGALLSFHHKENNEYKINLDLSLESDRYYIVIEDSEGNSLSDKIGLDVYDKNNIFTIDNINYLQLYGTDCVRVLPNNNYEYSETLILPNFVEHKGEKLKVTEIDSETFTNQFNVDAFVFPENVCKIGRDALPYDSKAVFLGSDLEIDYRLSYGTIMVFTPEENYINASKALEIDNRHELFTLSNDISLSKVPVSLEKPEDVFVSFDSSHPYKEICVQLDKENCLNYMILGDEEGNLILRMFPQNPGECTVTVSSLQPYKMISQNFTIKSLESSGINMTEKDGYDNIKLSGNILRIINPSAEVYVSDISGKTYPIERISEKECIFYAPYTGIYIINIGDKYFKTLMKF